MSRANLSMKIGFVSAVIFGLLIPAVAFGQESAEGRSGSKLPFLREASSGGIVTSSYGGVGQNGSGDSGSNGSGTVQVEPGGLISQANQCRFKDINGHKSEKAINYLYDHGVTGGRRPCYFDPDAKATRGEAAAMVVRAVAVEIPVSPEPKAFPDTNTKSWNARFVKSAKNNDIVHGYPDKLYRDEKSVNKVEALKIVTRAFKSDFSKTNLQELSSIDDIEFDQWYVQYVSAAVHEDLIAEGTKSIEPAAYVSRAELAQMIYDLMILRSRQ